MIKISSVRIKRYRSIMDMKLDFDLDNNFITVCGENNIGKTNTLRAIDLFFNPDKFEAEKDTPNYKYKGTRGGKVYPEIQVEFIEDNISIYKITKEFDQQGHIKTKGDIKQGKSKLREMTSEEIKNFHKKVAFFFIESINISLPNLINLIVDDIYDSEYANSQFRGIKSELKKSFDKYTDGLLSILHELAKEINPMFKEYNENWGVNFDLNTDVKKFRDLISDDIGFYIEDNSNKIIDAKGAGLQRLAYILLHFRLIEKIKNKAVLLLIDEPDIYLHQGLQKRLLKHLRQLTKDSQIIITTHSPLFIDSYTLNNVFLLEMEIDKKTIERKKGDFYDIRTKSVNIDSIDGAKKIKDYLGIDDYDYELLDRFNIIVEGQTDKDYITQLSHFFNIEVVPQIIPAHGVANIVKYLDFYNSFYSNTPNTYKPFILIIFDNDIAGRNEYKIIKNLIEKNKMANLEIKLIFIPHYSGATADIERINSIKANHEVEDFIYPALICYLANELLKRKQLVTINSNSILNKITKESFKNGGILNLLEYEKNDKNPDSGSMFSFTGSGGADNSIKTGLVGFLKIQGNKKLARLILEQDQKYPNVKQFIRYITEPKNFIS